MMLENFACAVPLFVGLGLYMWWASARQKAQHQLYTSSQELNRQMQELMREGIRLQTESNQLTRDLIDALRTRQ